MYTVLMNDRTVRGPRTGIPLYLTSILGNWPQDSDIRLDGFYNEILLRRSIPADQFVYGDLESLTPITVKPLSSLAVPPSIRDRQTPQYRLLARRLYSGMFGAFSRLGRYSIYFEPNNLAICRADRVVATMFDLSVVELPHCHPASRVRTWQQGLDNALKWTDHWIAISQATADAMHRVLSVPLDRISVIPLASRWPAPPSNWTPTAVRQWLGLPDRYFVYVGTLEPRKNIEVLLDAYSLLPEQTRRSTPLYLVGAMGWGDSSYWCKILNHPMAPFIRTTSYLTDDQAIGIVLGSRGLLYPSLYEGFGLPPLEAMSLGTPTAVSTAPSLREVCGHDAFVVEPHDADGWAEAMKSLSDNGSEREMLVNRGLERAGTFSWRKTAQLHHNLFSSIASGSRPLRIGPTDTYGTDRVSIGRPQVAHSA